MMAPLWKQIFILLRSWASSCTNLWNGSFLMSNLVDFWYRLISWRATVLGLYLWGFFCGLGCWLFGSFFTPPFAVPFFSTLGYSCFHGALPLPCSGRCWQNHLSSLLSGRGGGLLVYFIAISWLTSWAWFTIYSCINFWDQCSISEHAFSKKCVIP